MFITIISFKNFFQIIKAESVLHKQKEALTKLESIDFSDEFYSIVPYFKQRVSISNKRNLREKYELCQLIKDILSINESTNWNLKSSIKSKYSSIGAYIEPLNQESLEYSNITNDVLNSNLDLKILNIYEILRPNEHLYYKSNLKNQRRLYHGSKINNYLGILSRGLLLPKYVVDELGNETRNDIGLLGQGLYFSDSSNLSIFYTTASKSNNVRLLAICDVALGETKDYLDYDTSLTQAPLGYQSVRGVKRTSENFSKFSENEYVIYDTSQYKLKYLVEFECYPFIKEKDKNLKEIVSQDDDAIDLEGMGIILF